MVMVVDMKVFILSTCLTTLDTGELVVNHTVDGEEKTMRRRPWSEGGDVITARLCHHVTSTILSTTKENAMDLQ